MKIIIYLAMFLTIFNLNVSAFDFEVTEETLILLGYEKVNELYKEIFITDLEDDGKEEIVVYLYHYGPERGSLLIYDKYKNLITYQKDIGQVIYNCKFKDLVADKTKEIIINTAGSFGTGMYGKDLIIFRYNKFLSEIFRESIFISDYHMGSYNPKEYFYEINFEDISGDQDYEIVKNGYMVNVKFKNERYENGEIFKLEENIFSWDGEKYILSKWSSELSWIQNWKVDTAY